MGLLRRFVPDQAVASVAEIDLDGLRKRGIGGLLLDVDNTLAAWNSEEIAPETEAWLAKAREQFAVCIVSNSTKRRRIQALKERLGVEALAPAGKPWPCAFRKGMKVTGTAPEATIVVGDQLLTDVFGAHWAGCQAILVERVSPREFLSTRLVRPLERLLIGWLQRRGTWPTPEKAGSAGGGAD